MAEIQNNQEVLFPIPTSNDERDRILRAQEKETGWYKNFPRMETIDDIKNALEEGVASRVPDKGVGYVLSPGVKTEFKVLEKNTKSLLEEIAKKWINILTARGINTEGVYLRVTSLARTAEYQKELIAKGYPAAEDSTHVKLGAFDILISWLRNNRPELLESLTEVLDEVSAENRANVIEEPEIGVYHIAFNPRSIQ